ncbi:MAG: ribosome silencing factor [Clostridia bacterium]|jgi:ribosome-associated protein|nr:ribosome silencing factor [Clostridia bacterium]
MDSKELAKKIAEIMEDRKGKDVQIIDTSKSLIITDSFIICNGTSTTQVRAIADEIMFKLKEEYGIECHHTEGYETASWILIDYIDVVAHVFLQEDREFYNLERLYSDGIVERK